MEKLDERLWSWATEVDPGAILQATKASRLPIIEGHVALMPDAHVGIGATVGSVIPTRDAVIPSAVGVDIGCGMIAARLDITANQLPDSLDALLPRIGRAVPAGVGQRHKSPSRAAQDWMAANPPASELTTSQANKATAQLGSLGAGNHFFEVCLDEADRVWIVLHSGSRGIGKQLAQQHISRARQLAKDLDRQLEDPDLAWFSQGTPEFTAYIADLRWAQAYAMANRELMVDAALTEVIDFLGGGTEVERINCHHNFAQQERFGERLLWITRKGAIKADRGDRGVIPGSMGTRSYIVRGLGNEGSWRSCSHGAGRRHSRTAARRLFTAADLAEQMGDRAWLSNRAASLVDEIPSAYKDIDAVMAAQSDLVEVEHTLHQVLNYKGV